MEGFLEAASSALLALGVARAPVTLSRASLVSLATAATGCSGWSWGSPAGDIQSLSAPILEQLPSFIISDLPGVELKLEVAVAQLQKAQAQTGVCWIQSE